MIGKLLLCLILLLGAALRLPANGTNSTEKIVPPAPAREFRAAWIATVGNSCWPSKPGLTTRQQKEELLAILDRAASLKMNAVIFQVRPACDALYNSKLEPWSEYLTGAQGVAPSPYYDPLAFAIAEAHSRGLELHAWFNPFRARHKEAISPVSSGHISKKRPDLVRSYSRYLWLDPGEPAARDYSLRVVMDVLKRYDVDGIHFDDYFYPYPEKNRSSVEMDFPDSPSWLKSGVDSGLSRADWRRRNVDTFMEKVYRSIKAEKPWVKFGISPFGIWRPKTPPSINGLDAYDKLYADARKWLREGWCDYFSPQLYWGMSPPQTSFATLLDWWSGENVKRRHLWPGLNSLNVGDKWPASEITDQITRIRRNANPGHIHWSVMELMKNSNFDAALAREVYRQPALIPASPWLSSTSPPLPKLSVNSWRKSLHAEWKNGAGEPANWWVLQGRENGNWTTQVFPATRADIYLDNTNFDAIAIRAVGRTGNLSEPAVWQKMKK